MPRQRLYDAVVRAAGPLQPDEQPVFVTAAQVGNLMKNIVNSGSLTTAGSLLLGVISGGNIGVVFTPARYGVLLTNQRLMFVASQSDGLVFKDGAALSFPRVTVRATGFKKGLLTAKFDLVDEQSNPLMTLNFVTIDRKDGQQLAQLLTNA